MSDERAEEYRRMLRWYPAEWRRQNEDAIIGALLDEDDAARRSRPVLANRMSLVAGGLRQRFIAPERRSIANLIVLSAATALSLFYFTITWAPGSRYAGSIGPFSNPSVITGVLLIAAFVLALCGRGKTARLLAVLGIVAEIAVGALSQTFDWQGPSPYTVVLFAGLGLLAATPPTLSLVKRVAATAIVLLLVIPRPRPSSRMRKSRTTPRPEASRLRRVARISSSGKVAGKVAGKIRAESASEVGRAGQGCRDARGGIAPGRVELRLGEEERLREVCAAQLGVTQVGADEIGRAEVGTPEVGADQVGTPQARPAQVESGELGPHEVGAGPDLLLHPAALRHSSTHQLAHP
jgi:hypothetical protein